jgi:hypothetical protein
VKGLFESIEPGGELYVGLNNLQSVFLNPFHPFGYSVIHHVSLFSGVLICFPNYVL